MPQVRDPKTGQYTSGGGSSVGSAASTNPRIQKAAAVGAGATAGTTDHLKAQAERIVEGGSFSPTTVSKQLGVSEKEAKQYIVDAKKAVGARKGTTMGMESGESRKLNTSNMQDHEFKRAVQFESAEGTVIKTKSGTVYTKDSTAYNWLMKPKGGYTTHIIDPISFGNIGRGDVVEFAYIKK